MKDKKDEYLTFLTFINQTVSSELMLANFEYKNRNDSKCSLKFPCSARLNTNCKLNSLLNIKEKIKILF